MLDVICIAGDGFAKFGPDSVAYSGNRQVVTMAYELPSVGSAQTLDSLTFPPVPARIAKSEGRCNFRLLPLMESQSEPSSPTPGRYLSCMHTLIPPRKRDEHLKTRNKVNDGAEFISVHRGLTDGGYVIMPDRGF